MTYPSAASASEEAPEIVLGHAGFPQDIVKGARLEVATKHRQGHVAKRAVEIDSA